MPVEGVDANLSGRIALPPVVEGGRVVEGEDSELYGRVSAIGEADRPCDALAFADDETDRAGDLDLSCPPGAERYALWSRPHKGVLRLDLDPHSRLDLEDRRGLSAEENLPGGGRVHP